MVEERIGWFASKSLKRSLKCGSEQAERGSFAIGPLCSNELLSRNRASDESNFDNNFLLSLIIRITHSVLGGSVIYYANSNIQLNAHLNHKYVERKIMAAMGDYRNQEEKDKWMKMEVMSSDESSEEDGDQVS